jgi:hypothetical protein
MTDYVNLSQQETIDVTAVHIRTIKLPVKTRLDEDIQEKNLPYIA